MSELVFPRRHFLALLPAGRSLQPAAAGAPPKTLEEGFQSPPPAARPWVYWFWLNGHISREGLTADLEAMESVGIAGAIIMSNEGKIAPGPVRFMTPEWRDLFRHVVREADRLGIEIDMNNDDGWNAGGPWIEPWQSMQRMVWTETRVVGPRRFDTAIAQPPANLGFYRDIAVLAFRTPAGERPASARTPASAPPPDTEAPWRQVEFPAPFPARAVVVCQGKVEMSYSQQSRNVLF